MIAALAAAALLAQTPAAAQSSAASPGAAYDLSCAAAPEHAALQTAIAESYLADPGNAADALKSAIDEVLQGCAEEQGVGESDRTPFLRGSLAAMMMGEFDRRIRATGFDFAAIDALVAAQRADPDLDIAQFVDTRPELFAVPIARIASEQGLDDGYIEELVGGYAGFVSELDRAKAALTAR